MKAARYEMLGTPTLLYHHHHHTSSSASNNNNNDGPSEQDDGAATATNQSQQQRFHPSIYTPQQLQMKEYLQIDPPKYWFADNKNKKGGGEKYKLPAAGAAGAGARLRKRCKLESDEGGSIMMDDNNSNNGGDGKGEEKKRALKYCQFELDESDVPAEYKVAVASSSSDASVAGVKYTDNEGGDSVKQHSIKEEEEEDDDDEYDDIEVQQSEVVTEETTFTNEVGGPLGYGNCLVAIECTCQFCYQLCSSDIAPPATASTIGTSSSSSVGSTLDQHDAKEREEEETNDQTTPTMFLVHPTGERLSSVTIDKLIMPRDHHQRVHSTLNNDSKKSINKSINNTINVGGTILQIAQCGKGVSNKLKRMNQDDDEDDCCQSECLVVRTSRYCVVILAKSTTTSITTTASVKGRKSGDEDGNDNSSSSDDDDDSTVSSTIKQGQRQQQKGRCCSTTFELIQLSRIDLSTVSSSSPQGPSLSSYLPVYTTCDPKAIFSPFVNPTFAILSRTNRTVKSAPGIDCTTIHEVVQIGSNETRVSTHKFSKVLANMSLIEYDSSDMSILWSAARGINVPKTYHKDYRNNDKKNDGGRGVLRGGYGHSLFKINLRNDSATQVWSPSLAEYTPEGTHSINGIMVDLCYKHIVWISSSSVCKVWALDIRHRTANVVMSFSLAQLSDDFGTELGVCGIYGAGMLMAQPMSTMDMGDDNDDDDDDSISTNDLGQQHRQLLPKNNILPPTMFGVKKDPNAYSLHVYQLPTTMSRFQTMPLEASNFVEGSVMKHSTSCIARSNIYTLPVCSDKTFRVGLVTLRCSSNSVLREVDWRDALGYDTAPEVVYALTMTSVGDIYCHTLLECDGKKEVRAVRIEGMPVGTAAMKVPLLGGESDRAGGNGSENDDDSGHRSEGLRLSLSNTFPAPFNDVALS